MRPIPICWGLEAELQEKEKLLNQREEELKIREALLKKSAERKSAKLKEVVMTDNKKETTKKDGVVKTAPVIQAKSDSEKIFLSFAIFFLAAFLVVLLRGCNTEPTKVVAKQEIVVKAPVVKAVKIETPKKVVVLVEKPVSKPVVAENLHTIEVWNDSDQTIKVQTFKKEWRTVSSLENIPPKTRGYLKVHLTADYVKVRCEGDAIWPFTLSKERAYYFDRESGQVVPRKETWVIN